MVPLGLPIAIVAGTAILVAFLYNTLVGRRNDVENAFGSVDVLLKKRHDLIPNLVAAVKRYMKHEADLLGRVTELRSRALQGGLSPDETVDLENQITRSVGQVMVAVESYPELKADEQFQQLQRSLNEVEEQISAARRAFNAAVTSLNNGIEMFPSNLVAAMMGLQRRKVFEIPDVQRENVDVAQLFQG